MRRVMSLIIEPTFWEKTVGDINLPGGFQKDFHLKEVEKKFINFIE